MRFCSCIIMKSLMSYSKARFHTPGMKNLGSLYGFSGSSTRINCEHIIPQSKFKLWGLNDLRVDMHNLYPCCEKLNSIRQNFPFAENSTRLLRVSDHVVKFENNNERFFVPPEYARGKIARICLHFIHDHPQAELEIYKHVLHHDLLYKWDKFYEPDESEMQRLWLINYIQKQKQTFFLH